MEEKTLYKIALITTVIGLIILYLYAEEIKLNSLHSLDENPAAEKVILTGTVKKISMRDKATFLELWGEKVEKTDVIIFNDADVYLEENDEVEITGTVEDYNGKKEVIASKVVLK
jgi:hypothetical protein